jgi:hypothetical protein
MIFIRAWILMLVLGIIYSITGWHWHKYDHQTVILALSYWWCLFICVVAWLIKAVATK